MMKKGATRNSVMVNIAPHHLVHHHKQLLKDEGFKITIKAESEHKILLRQTEDPCQKLKATKEEPR